MNSDRIQIEASNLYWAEARLPGRRITDSAVGFALEPMVPVPLDELVVRSVRVDRDRVIICAIERDALLKLIGQRGGAVESVTPETIPEWIEPGGLSARALEFRNAGFESAGNTRCRRLSRLVALAGCVIVAGLLVFGLRSRAEHSSELAGAYDRGATDVAASTLQAPPDGVDPLLLMTAELRRIDLTRATADDVAFPESISSNFMMLLDAWPEEVPVRIDTLSMNRDRISASGAFAAAENFDTFRASLASGMSGWQESTSNLQRSQREFRFSLVYLRNDPGGEP